MLHCATLCGIIDSDDKKKSVYATKGMFCMARIGETIRQLRIQNGLTQKELADKLHLRHTTLGNYERGEREPDAATIEAIADFFGVPVSDFFGRSGTTTSGNPKGPMTVADAFHLNPPKQHGLDDVANRMIQYIEAMQSVNSSGNVPIIGAVRCGVGGLAYEDLQGAAAANVKNPSEYFYLRAEGDSMEPMVFAGDLVLVHIQDDIESGDIAVVIIDGEEGVLKKFIMRDGAVILQSFNPSYQPRIFIGDKINELRVVGKAVSVTREL